MNKDVAWWTAVDQDAQDQSLDPISMMWPMYSWCMSFYILLVQEPSIFN